MNFKVLPTPLFERELKKLSKRYPSIKNDLAATIVSLKETPTPGEPLEIIVLKSGWPYLQKIKANRAGRE